VVQEEAVVQEEGMELGSVALTEVPGIATKCGASCARKETAEVDVSLASGLVDEGRQLRLTRTSLPESTDLMDVAPGRASVPVMTPSVALHKPVERQAHTQAAALASGEPPAGWVDDDILGPAKASVPSATFNEVSQVGQQHGSCGSMSGIMSGDVGSVKLQRGGQTSALEVDAAQVRRFKVQNLPTELRRAVQQAILTFQQGQEVDYEGWSEDMIGAFKEATSCTAPWSLPSGPIDSGKIEKVLRTGRAVRNVLADYELELNDEGMKAVVHAIAGWLSKMPSSKKMKRGKDELTRYERRLKQRCKAKPCPSGAGLEDVVASAKASVPCAVPSVALQAEQRQMPDLMQVDYASQDAVASAKASVPCAVPSVALQAEQRQMADRKKKQGTDELGKCVWKEGIAQVTRQHEERMVSEQSKGVNGIGIASVPCAVPCVALQTEQRQMADLRQSKLQQGPHLSVPSMVLQAEMAQASQSQGKCLIVKASPLAETQPHLHQHGLLQPGPIQTHEVLSLLNQGRAVRKVIWNYERQYSVESMRTVVTTIDNWLQAQRYGDKRTRGEEALLRYVSKVKTQEEVDKERQREMELMQQEDAEEIAQAEAKQKAHADAKQAVTDEELDAATAKLEALQREVCRYKQMREGLCRQVQIKSVELKAVEDQVGKTLQDWGVPNCSPTTTLSEKAAHCTGTC